MALYRTSDQFLVAAPTVGIRAVKKIDADLTRAAQGFDRRISVGLVVKWRHRRAAETDRGNLEPAEPVVDEVAEQFRSFEELGYTDILVRHLTNDQPKVLGSLERLTAVRAALA